MLELLVHLWNKITGRSEALAGDQQQTDFVWCLVGNVIGEHLVEEEKNDKVWDEAFFTWN